MGIWYVQTFKLDHFVYISGQSCVIKHSKIIFWVMYNSNNYKYSRWILNVNSSSHIEMMVLISCTIKKTYYYFYWFRVNHRIALYSVCSVSLKLIKYWLLRRMCIVWQILLGKYFLHARRFLPIFENRELRVFKLVACIKCWIFPRSREAWCACSRKTRRSVTAKPIRTMYAAVTDDACVSPKPLGLYLGNVFPAERKPPAGRDRQAYRLSHKHAAERGQTCTLFIIYIFRTVLVDGPLGFSVRLTGSTRCRFLDKFDTIPVEIIIVRITHNVYKFTYTSDRQFESIVYLHVYIITSYS